MKTILVDDMLLDLQLFELKCADLPDFEIVGKFTDPNAAIEYASGHVVDFALLDIDMPGMDGIQLAQALRLDTYAGNEPAAGLYRGLGFRYAGRAECDFQGLITEPLIFFEHPVEMPL